MTIALTAIILALVCVILFTYREHRLEVHMYKTIADSEKRIRIIAEESRDALAAKFIDRYPPLNTKYIN